MNRVANTTIVLPPRNPITLQGKYNHLSSVEEALEDISQLSSKLQQFPPQEFEVGGEGMRVTCPICKNILYSLLTQPTILHAVRRV